jgi:hypothetical protein
VHGIDAATVIIGPACSSLFSYPRLCHQESSRPARTPGQPPFRVPEGTPRLKCQQQRLWDKYSDQAGFLWIHLRNTIRLFDSRASAAEGPGLGGAARDACVARRGGSMAVGCAGRIAGPEFAETEVAETEVPRRKSQSGEQADDGRPRPRRDRGENRAFAGLRAESAKRPEKKPVGLGRSRTRNELR